MQRWVEIKIKWSEYMPTVIDFLLTIATTKDKQFKEEDMIRFNPTILKHGLRYLRELRFKGLVRYEMPCRQTGIYVLKSDVFELQIAKNRIANGGYHIEQSSPVVIPKQCKNDVEQLSLIS